MKKFCICFSIILIIISVFAACNKTATEEGTADAGTASKTSTSYKPPVVVDPTFDDRTVGSVQTSEKFGGGSEYYIEYYDENGFVVKSEVYENGKMVYYSTVNIADSMGNGKQVSYYTSGGSFVATYKDGIFRDSAGNEMSETEFEKKLGR